MSNVPRAKKVSQSDFIKGYVSGCADGLTVNELSSRLGMNTASMISRASGYRTAAAEIGKLFPSPKGSDTTVNKKREKIDLLTSLLDDLDSDETEEESVE